MMYPTKQGLRAVVACMVIVVCGCGGRSPVEVEGTVTLAGKPLSGALITFYPEDSAGHVAVGTTDPDGKFELTTLEEGDGVLPGRYKITVLPTAAAVDAGYFVTIASADDKQRVVEKLKISHSPKAVAERKAASPIHANYGSIESTPLRSVITEATTVDIQLTQSGQ